MAHPAPSRGFLGILMLETRFPRPPGDIGHPDTFRRAGIPVRYLTVAGSSPRRVVQEGGPALLQPFLEAAVELDRQGAALISTSCGFLAAWQDAMAAAVPVPVITSSLLQVRAFAHPGIVTIEPATLGPALAGAGVPAGTPVQGVAPGVRVPAPPGRGRHRPGMHEHAALSRSRRARHGARGARHRDAAARSVVAAHLTRDNERANAA